MTPVSLAGAIAPLLVITGSLSVGLGPAARQSHGGPLVLLTRHSAQHPHSRMCPNLVSQVSINQHVRLFPLLTWKRHLFLLAILRKMCFGPLILTALWFLLQHRFRSHPHLLVTPLLVTPVSLARGATAPPGVITGSPSRDPEKFTMVTNPHVRLSPLLVIPVLLAGATVSLWWLRGSPRRNPTAHHPHVLLCLHPAQGATARLLAITGQGLLFLLCLLPVLPQSVNQMFNLGPVLRLCGPPDPRRVAPPQQPQ